MATTTVQLTTTTWTQVVPAETTDFHIQCPFVDVEYRYDSALPSAGAPGHRLRGGESIGRVGTGILYAKSLDVDVEMIVST